MLEKMSLPTILLRILCLRLVLDTILLSFVSKKLRPFNLLPRITSNSVSLFHHIIMETEELMRVFHMFDRNGDGRVTKKELNDSLENMGIFMSDSDLTQMINKIDVNGDGYIDIDEFGALYETIMEEQDEEEDIREAFNVFDQNGDGFITVDELKSVLASLGLKQGRTVDDCKQMIKRVDADGDGMVNFTEFKQMMKSGGFAALS